MQILCEKSWTSTPPEVQQILLQQQMEYIRNKPVSSDTIQADF